MNKLQFKKEKEKLSKTNMSCCGKKERANRPVLNSKKGTTIHITPPYTCDAIQQQHLFFFFFFFNV
jgi:hypothetical protein